MNPKNSISTETTKAGIRWMAVVMAAMMWCIGLGVSQHYGNGPSSASAAAVCGLAAWFTYHVVSRQNNGLIIICMGLVPIWRENGPFWSLIRTFLPISVTIGVFMGLTTLGFNAVKAGFNAWRARMAPSGHVEPLYDAQLDNPI